MSNPLRIAVFGITGRMGKALIAALDETPNARLTAACGSPSSSWVGHDLRELGARHGGKIVASAVEALEEAQVAIDFSLPAATGANLAACVSARRALVIGTTGFDESVRAQIAAAAREIPIVLAPNMSLGVNLLLRLVELAAQKLDDVYDIEIFEAHHRNKKDAPSGTALALGDTVAKARGVSLEVAADHVRHGATGARRRGSIGFSVFRGGDVVGDHTVTFAGPGERIELTHRASDRLAFARGAVQAAQWLVSRAPGLYSMRDVLGLNE